jgi:hypothetical protein
MFGFAYMMKKCRWRFKSYWGYRRRPFENRLKA